ncbi:DNA internalization-related competence protein ComEC/Rec2 [Pseudomonadota bacterium]
MRLAVIAFLLGIVAFQQLPMLPSVWWGVVMLPLMPLAFYFPHLRPLFWLVAGFVYTFLHAGVILSSSLAPQLEGRDVTVEGVISSIPVVQVRRARFEYDIERVVSPGVTLNMLPRRVRLNIYNHFDNLDVGQRWRLTVRLKQPHGFMNPGGFDYEAWLYRHKIRATGYVRTSDENRFLSDVAMGYQIDRWRSALSKKIDSALPNSEYAGVIKALAIGNREGISGEQWQVLLKTGTNHLMAISGLHVGLIAGLCFVLVRSVWVYFPGLMLRWPKHKAGAVAAILAALGYAAMAGFSIPTQRALIMVVVFMFGLLSQRYRRPVDGLLLALLLVLLLDPLAVMDAGFWLSFAAVGFILFVMSGRIDRKGGVWWRWGRVHVIMAVALLPITLLFFQKASLISPLANLFAVPWMTLCIVPLVLLGSTVLSISTIVGTWLLQLADVLLASGWYILEWCAQVPMAQLSFSPASSWLFIPAVIGCVWLLLPFGWPGRWLGLIWLATLFFVPFPRPSHGEAWFTLLDVGQGLATVIQTREHVLVFDTGPRFSDSFDTGAAVVLPFLRHLGMRRIDMMVVSHGDNDHLGGAHSILEDMPVDRILTSAQGKLQPFESFPCRAGNGWQWDGVVFEILHPTDVLLKSENDNSCVLKVTVDEVSLLMTGDIEHSAERQLVSRYQTSLSSDVLVVPHHGSKTSSTPEFINAVDPDWALIAVGYQNRFKLPNPEILERYRQKGITVLQSSRLGAVSFRVSLHGISDPEGFRFSNGRYWTHFP